MTITNVHAEWSPLKCAWQIVGECAGKRVAFSWFATKGEALAWWRGIEGGP